MSDDPQRGIRFRDWPVPWEAAAILAVPLVLLAYDAVRGAPLGGAAFVAVVLWGTVGLLASTRRGMSGRPVTVRDDALRVGFWDLPATSIGTVEPLTPAEARVTGGARHLGDRRIHLSTANRLHNTLGAVAVEDLRHDPARVWIVTTRRPDELRDALESIRRPARDTRTTR